MMKHLYLYMAICLGGLFAASCSDDEDTTPSMADTDRLETLLDTSNPDMVEFKQKYGSYLLYEFDPILDFAYQFEEAQAWRSAKLTLLDKADVSQAVTFLKDNFFNCYSDAMLATFLPRKVLLCGKIEGTTLGVSYVPDGRKAFHDAVANLNSMSIGELSQTALGGMDNERRATYLRQLHFIFLGGYVINARTQHIVEEGFYDYCRTLYNTLMDPSRLQAEILLDRYGPEFFYRNGFLPPEKEYATYYSNREDDLIAFTKQLIHMDQAMHDTAMQYEMLRAKMQYVARGLKNMGVAVDRINPLITDFL